MTLKSWRVMAVERLQQANIETAKLDADLLLAHVLQCRREDLYLRRDEKLNSDTINTCAEFLQRRLQGEPIAYLIGKKEFYGRDFLVDKNVLVPRPETELIIEMAKEIFLSQNNLNILDLGTGSGCLAVTLALEFPNAELTAIDISSHALKIAEKNRERFQLTKRLQLLELDLSAPNVVQALKSESFDLIVANPPYVGSQDEIQESVKQHEPYQALFSGDTQGVKCYQEWLIPSKEWIKSGGSVLLEIGTKQARAVSDILLTTQWNNIRCRQDLAGLDRVVAATK